MSDFASLPPGTLYDLDQQAQARQAEAARVQFQAAVQLDPELFARQRNLAERMGLPTDTVERNAEFVQRLEREEQLRTASAAAAFPALATNLQRFEFAALAQDDLDALQRTEGVYDWISRNFTTGSRITEAGSINARIAAGWANTGDIERLRQINRSLRYQPQNESLLARMVGGSLEMVGQYASALPTAFAAAGAAAGAAVLAGPLAPVTVPTAASAGFFSTLFAQSAWSEGGALFDDLVQAGYDPENARVAAAAGGIVIGALDAVGLKITAAPAKGLMRKVLTNRLASVVQRGATDTAWWRFVGSYGAGVLGEATTEVAQELVAVTAEDLLRSYTRPEITSKWSTVEGRAEISDRVWDVFGKTVESMILLGLPLPAARLAMDLRREADVQVQTKVLQGISQGAVDPKLAERAPDLMQQFVRDAAGASVPELFIDAQAFSQVVLQAEKARIDAGELSASVEGSLRSIMPATVDSIAEAAVRGGDVVIPTEKFTRLGDKLREALLPHLRVREDLPSAAEVEKAAKLAPALEAGAKKARDQARADAVEFREQLQEVRKAFQAEAIAAREPGERARIASYLYSLFVGRMAREEGIAPRDWHSARGARVVFEPEGAAQAPAPSPGLGQAVDAAPADAQAPATQAPATQAPATQAPAAPTAAPAPAEAVPTAEAPAATPSGQPAAAPSNQPAAAPSNQPAAAPTAQPAAAAAGAQATPAPGELRSGLRGSYVLSSRTIKLTEAADASTVAHELAHFFLENYARVATQENAPPAVRRDFEALLEWLKIDGLSGWAKLAANDKRIAHETVAYAWESYLWGGKAPTPKLRSIFGRISAFIRDAYRDLRTRLNATYRAETGRDLPVLTDDVRRVFDRMLAAEDQVRFTQVTTGAVPLFQTKEQFLEGGGTAEQWDELERIRGEADESMVATLTARSLRAAAWSRNARDAMERRIKAEARDVRADIRAEVTAEYAAFPVYRAIRWLRTGKADPGEQADRDGNHKLARAEVEKLLPVGASMAKLDEFVVENGISPGAIAKAFEFDSGAEMVQVLLDTPELEAAVEAEVEARMLRDYAELADPKQINQAIDEAMHDTARAKYVTAELAFLAKTSTPHRVMREAARIAAERAIGTSRVRGLRPSAFAAAAARSAKAAVGYLREADPEAAIGAKRQQLLQQEMARVAVQARAEIDKAEARWQKFLQPDTSVFAARDMGLVAAGRAVLASIGFGSSLKLRTELQTRTGELLRRIREYDVPMAEEIDKIVSGISAAKSTYSDLAYDEFRLLDAALTSLWDNAKRKNEIEAAGQKVQLSTAVGEMMEALAPLLPTTPPPGSDSAVTARQSLMRGLHSLSALNTRLEFAFDELDGPRDGVGPFTKYFWRPVKEAIDAYRVERTAKVKELLRILEAVKFEDKEIAAPELRYTFGASTGGRGQVELLAALFNIGNDGNFAGLLIGGRGQDRPWVPDRNNAFDDAGNLDKSMWNLFMANAIKDGRITEQMLDAAQAVWDLFETVKPLTQRAHRALFGTFFDEVQARPFTVNFPDGRTKTYRGGYYPKKTDPDIVPDARVDRSLDEMEGDWRKEIPSTGYGFTKARVAEYNKALALDIRLAPRHLDDTIRFGHVQPAVRNAVNLLRDEKLRTALDQVKPNFVEGAVVPWLTRAARQTTEVRGMNPLVDSFWRGVRRRSGLATLFANIGNALQQVTGIFPALLKVPPRYLMPALFEVLRRGPKAFNDIAGKSKFMAERFSSKMLEANESLSEILLNPNALQKLQRWSNVNGYFLQNVFQSFADATTWLGAYNHSVAKSKGQTDAAAEAAAVAAADAAVSQTQGSTAPESMSRYEAGTPFLKTLTQFQGYFNTMAQLNKTEYRKLMREDLGYPGKIGRGATVFVLGFAAPMLVADAIARAARGEFDDDDDDGYDDEVADWFFGGLSRGALSMVPFGGNLAVVALNSWNDKAYDDRMMTSPSISALEASTIGVVRAGINALDPEKDVTGKNIRDIFTLLTLVFGIPFSAAGRVAGYGRDVSLGRVEPYNDADAVRGFVTGSAAPGTRER